MVLRLSSRFISSVTLILLAIAGLVLVLHATPEGLILSDDSIAYIAGARSMLAGHGYREAWLASNGPVTHFPPAYPALLTFLGWFGLDPLRGARFVGALLFGANSALLGILAWRMTRWLPAGLLVSFLFVLNAPLLRLHASALTEPLFIFLCLLAFWMFDLYHERDSHWLWLVACGTTVGIAYLTRYAALALAATVALAVLVVHKSWKRRLEAVVTFAVSMAPWLVGWGIRNSLVGGTATNRLLAWHPITASNANTAWRTLADFMLPLESWREQVLRAEWVMPGLALCILVGLGALALYRLRQLQILQAPGRPEILSFIHALFALAYLASIVVAMLLFDASTKFKPRILAPAHVSVIFLLVALAAWGWKRRRELVIVGGLAVLALSAWGQITTVSELARGAQGYASFRWYDSKAMEFLRELPPAVAIYTNEPGAVYLHTDRPAYVLPDRVDPVTAAARPGFESGLRELQAEVNSGRAVLALFSGGDLPAEDGAALSSGLTLIHKSGGAEIFGAAP